MRKLTIEDIRGMANRMDKPRLTLRESENLIIRDLLGQLAAIGAKSLMPIDKLLEYDEIVISVPQAYSDKIKSICSHIATRIVISTNAHSDEWVIFGHNKTIFKGEWAMEMESEVQTQRFMSFGRNAGKTAFVDANKKDIEDGKIQIL
ncbi:hypothetical protein VB796_21060 [Arcicella sp. LKC2W]|uniref:hypothetical protein n=1 Tax=Arcicella sp. LKC2W TaxID=2984198 RepID=UPI002B1FAB2A|nr:hypothetical protein [Arcicella sp. LKC2W]MEA5461570.1 hypothetical protein [Arcicella sp. LKC2W]